MPSAIYSKTRNPCDFCFATLSSAILCERKKNLFHQGRNIGFSVYLSVRVTRAECGLAKYFKFPVDLLLRESKRETFIFRRNYPLSTHIMELFLRISPVCQMTAALLRLNLNFESDLLDDPHLVQQLIITWRKKSSPEECPRCGSYYIYIILLYIII